MFIFSLRKTIRAMDIVNDEKVGETKMCSQKNSYFPSIAKEY